MALDPKSSSLVQDALTIFNHARDKRRPLVSKWTRNYHVVHNRTWGTARPAGHPRTEIPEIYPIIASIVAWTTDSSPRFNVSPNMPPNTPYVQMFDDLATDLEWILTQNWEREDYDAEIQQVLWDGEQYGIGYAKSCWEPTLDNGMGNVILRRVDPYAIYLDPDAHSWRDVNYLFEVRTMSRDELRRRFPDKSDLDDITFKIGDTHAAPNQVEGFTTNPGQVRPNPGSLPNPAGGTNVTSFSRQPGAGPQIVDDGVTVVELWYRTVTESDLPASDPDDPTPPNSKYRDEWRCLVFAGQTVLMHESASDIYGHGRHPYSRYVPIEEGELYGYSLVEQLAPLQISINRMFASVEHNAWLSGNPILIRRSGSRTTITNRPGETFETGEPNQDVRWLDPPQMHPLHKELIQMAIAEMERISGMSAVVRGYSPQGRPSEGTMDSVQDSAFVRIRMRLRNFERFLRDAGLLCAATITEFYDKERVLSRIGPDGERTVLPLLDQHFYVPSPDGEILPLSVNLSVTAGASQAISRQAKESKAERLFALGAFDVPALLEWSEVPKWKEIADRVQSQQAAAGTLGMPPTQRAAARR